MKMSHGRLELLCHRKKITEECFLKVICLCDLAEKEPNVRHRCKLKIM